MSEKSFSRRSANFNSSEIDFLIKTIIKYRDIIECKKTDLLSAQEKTKAWKEIEREYNQQFDYNFRSAKVLKTKYHNLKKNAKKIIQQRDNGASFTRAESDSSPKTEKVLEDIAFMDETEFSTDKLLSETVREYFEENLPENGNTSSSWQANEDEYADDTDEREDVTEKDRSSTSSDCKDSLLAPMFSKTSIRTRHDISSNSTNKCVPNIHSSALENTSSSEIRSSGKRERNSLPNETGLEYPPRKSSIHLFCDSLAMQIEEAQLTPHQLSSLQIDFLKKLQEYLPTDK